jgi:hypothetical protein
MRNLETSLLSFSEEIEKPLSAESVDRTTHNSTKKDRLLRASYEASYLIAKA